MAPRSAETTMARPEICKFWASSRCLKKHKCPYLHPEKMNHTQPQPTTNSSVSAAAVFEKTKKGEKLCKFWADRKCVKGEGCPYVHSWYRGDDISPLAKLEGHKKGVTGIVLPENTSNLYSAAKDGTVRVWDCTTGECSRVINLGAEAGCLTGKGVWVFCGASNLVKAWNTECNTEFTLEGSVAGRVLAMEVGDDMVFAGTEEGVIYVWKGKPCSDAKANPFHPRKALSGHSGAVLSLRVGNFRLYSGSADHTIRVWNMDTLECSMVLKGHSDAVTSVICWTSCLLSCSLDKTIKAWSMGEGGKIEEIYTHTEEEGLLALCGMHDAEDQPVLLCSSKDNSVRIYDLPSLYERGRVFAKREIHAIQVAKVDSGNLFFTGDETGGLSVWKWLEPAVKQES